MSEEQKELDLYLAVEDGTGRQFIGQFVEKNDRTIKLRDPLLIVERVMPAQQMQEQQQIMLNISPLMHTFVINEWTFKWSGFHEVQDEKLKSTYEKFLTQMRAARSGLSVASAMPPNGGPIQMAQR
jgi:hypothetical protein